MTNPPAFPVPIKKLMHDTRPEDFKDNECAGMTLRDYFAASVIGQIYQQTVGKELGSDYMANCAYIVADAMLKAREQ